MIIIGLDIGTTTICGVALELPEGRLLKAIVLPNDSAMANAANAAEASQRPDVIMRKVDEITRQLLALYPNAAGIGVTGQMHGILYLDARGKAVSPLYTWQDRRGLLSSRDGATVADLLSRKTGYPVSTGYGLVTHAALTESGEVPQEAAAICTIADYTAMRLANRAAPIMEASNAASIGLFDVERGRFDEAALGAGGISPHLLPAVLPSTTPVGETGGGIPVFNAIGDNQASVLGSLPDLRTSLLLNVGTGGQLTAFSERYLSVEGLETRPFPGGSFLLVGASLAGGKSYAILESLFRSILAAFSDSSQVIPPLYGRMEQLLDQAWPADDKLTVRSQFVGTRRQSELRGAIEGIGPANLTPQHLIAGFLEGMAEELYGFYLQLPEEIRGGFHTLTGSGNGIRSNRHLRRVCAERFAMPIQLSVFREEASVGAALHAAVALGAVEGYGTAGRLLAWERAASPDLNAE